MFARASVHRPDSCSFKACPLVKSREPALHAAERHRSLPSSLKRNTYQRSGTCRCVQAILVSTGLRHGANTMLLVGSPWLQTDESCAGNYWHLPCVQELPSFLKPALQSGGWPVSCHNVCSQHAAALQLVTQAAVRSNAQASNQSVHAMLWTWWLQENLAYLPG